MERKDKVPKRYIIMSSKRTSNKRKRESNLEDEPDSKKIKVYHRGHHKEAGVVLVLGEGTEGQLGLGKNILERNKLTLLPLPEKSVQVAAGNMHTVCLTESGQIYTFGCNYDGELGRQTPSEWDPEKVFLEEKVVQVSAGGRHTAALTEDGDVYIWGCFRDNTGVIGLLEPLKKCRNPIKVPITEPVGKIASGQHHLVMVTVEGNVYTMGSAHLGQLGRVAKYFTKRGGRTGLERMLTPQKVRVKGKVTFVDAFCGAFSTFALTEEGEVYGFGFSNHHQLGTKSTGIGFFPVKLAGFKNSTTSWVEFCGGYDHTLCLDAEGHVYSLGRGNYGCLGLGEEAEEKSAPTRVMDIGPVQNISCGPFSSCAVTREGSVFVWGVGCTSQLGLGEDDDLWSPLQINSVELEDREVLMASGGVEHTVLLATDIHDKF